MTSVNWYRQVISRDLLRLTYHPNHVTPVFVGTRAFDRFFLKALEDFLFRVAQPILLGTLGTVECVIVCWKRITRVYVFVTTVAVTVLLRL